MGNWWSQSDELIKPGDLIEVFRVSFQHWAVYVGDGYVVHVTAPPDGEVATEKAMVRKEKLKGVLGDDKWRINNSLDKKNEPRQAHIIVEEALGQVDKMIEYSLIRKNCEHFVTKLRYGKAVSIQAEKAGTFGTILMAAVEILRGSSKWRKTK